MTTGIDKLTDEELLKVVMCIAAMTKKSIAAVCEKLEDKDINRLVDIISKNKKLWDK